MDASNVCGCVRVSGSSHGWMSVKASSKLLADDALGPWPRLCRLSLVVAAGDMQVPYKQVALPLNATLDGYST